MVTGKLLKLRGWPDGKVIGLAKLAGWSLERDGLATEVALDQLDAVRAAPGDYLLDARYADLARELLRREAAIPQLMELRATPLEYPVWGAAHIEAAARQQMANALRLPVAVAGALMPDAHVGYGLPIGGVLATADAVIPYAVGVDIACRMRLSVFEPSPITLGQRPEQFRRALLERTRFGMNGKWDAYDLPDHPVLADPAWGGTRFLRALQPKARHQLGTSGTGNHFVEWGEFRLMSDDADLGLKAGKYLALLSHSGSRGVGFAIANLFSRLAREAHPELEDSVRQLAWLSLRSEAGQDYWQAMQLAGRFAAANHAVIHQRVAHAAGLREIASVENHHNFAWEERLADGSVAVVHRKGATPAGPGVLGIIPGSMGDGGYIVRGRGNAAALNSAAHGAGRRMSRRKAAETITRTERDRYLRERGVQLLGGGIDESPQAYKDIQAIIAAQDDLVEVIGTFTPRIVRMADEAGEF